MKNLKAVAVAVAVVVMAAGMVCAEGYYYKQGLEQENTEVDSYDVKDSKTGFWILGGGLMVGSLPLSQSETNLPMVFFAYESIHKKMLGSMDFSWSIGFYDLMPEVEFAAIMPVKPFDVRIAVGGYYDFIIGGHAGMFFKAGMIINKLVGVDLVMIPIGTQPSVSYQDSIEQGEIVPYDGENGLDFPIYGLLVSLRF